MSEQPLPAQLRDYEQLLYRESLRGLMPSDTAKILVVAGNLSGAAADRIDELETVCASVFGRACSNCHKWFKDHALGYCDDGRLFAPLMKASHE
jgi:hypothetical protein